MGIATHTETLGGGDYRWLDSSRGTGHPISGTINLSTLDPEDDYPAGYVPSGLPVKFNSGSGLYEQCDAEDTHLTLAGYVWHNVTIQGTENPVVAILTDATIVAEFVPGVHDLADGRYLTDRVDTDPAPEIEGGDD